VAAHFRHAMRDITEAAAVLAPDIAPNIPQRIRSDRKPAPDVREPAPRVIESRASPLDAEK